ncbi:uncharacterized protein LOC119737252 isoform X2 [Patiria miniata]|nr:uncharacterized protein LOC119737252 isoform X2 [Patiria miniata]
MTLSAMLPITTCLLAVLAMSSALTDEQIARFMTSDRVEGNTGETGMVTIATANGMHTITSNGVPDHATPDYPNSGNPNDITVQTHEWTIPVNPTVAESTTDLPLGPIGVAINGIPFFNPYTATGEDAVLTETFDSCDGHPTNRGTYHYHKQPSSCVFSVVDGEPSPLIGVALDGFPIYGPNDENGNTLTSSDLDACHGRFVNGQYQYHTTSDFPYIMGCFKGEYTRTMPPNRPPGGGPPNGNEPPAPSDNSPSDNGQANLKSSLLLMLSLLALMVAIF